MFMHFNFAMKWEQSLELLKVFCLIPLMLKNASLSDYSFQLDMDELEDTNDASFEIIDIDSINNSLKDEETWYVFV